MKLILDKGHSRVPVYYEQQTNVIGLILVSTCIFQRGISFSVNKRLAGA